MKKLCVLLLLIMFLGCASVQSVLSYDDGNVRVIRASDASKFNNLLDEEILIILDYSSSMIKKLNDQSRATHAILALHQVLNSIPQSAKIGLRVFGPDEQSMHEYNSGINSRGDCRATKLAVPISSNNIYSIKNKLSEYTRPFGETPIVYSIAQALNNDFLSQNSMKHIVLITDGDEGCGGNPCRFIRDIMRNRNDIKIDVIAIASDDTNSFMGLSCLANATNGQYIVVRNADDLYLKMKTTIVYLPEKNQSNNYNTPDIQPPKPQIQSPQRQNNKIKEIKYKNYMFEFNI